MTTRLQRRLMLRTAKLAAMAWVLALAYPVSARLYADETPPAAAPATPAAAEPAPAAAPPTPLAAVPSQPTAPLNELPLNELIDQQIGAALAAKGIAPAVLADDAEFLRRIYLDLTGTIPTLGEAKAFLDDKSPLKRQQLVDRLLNSAEYARQMQRVFDVILMERRPANRVPQAEWEAYLRNSFAANKPWDALVREILTADGADPGQRPAARFYLDRDAEPNLLTRDVGRLMLGRDMQCAQCHDHPLVDHYLQADYYGLMAFFNRSFVFTPNDKKQPPVIAEKGEGDVVFKSVFVEGATDQPARPHLPGEKELIEPQFVKGQEYVVAPAKGVQPVPKYSRRSLLPELLARPDNVAFRRNIANRLWALMMGRGLFNPLDMDHPGNPPSHPELLNQLADRFAAMKFDVKAFLRELALSQTYQRSSALPPGVESLPAESFAVARLKPLSAEQLALASLQATGITDVYRASLGPSLNEQTLYDKLAGNLGPFVAIFAGQAGQPEQDFQATLEQILFVSNGGVVRSWISPQSGNLTERLGRIAEPPAVADEMYLCALSRRPAAEEVAELTAFLQARAQDRPAALQEWIWGLLASDEFRFNH
jgi:hypothetical protein